MLSEVRSLSGLIFPSCCVGCSEPQVEICSSCWQLWKAAPISSRLDALPISFTARYQPKVQRFILAAKEEGSRAARSVLALAMANSLRQIIVELSIRRVLLVPIPSHPSSIRRRGRDHALRLSQAVAGQFGAEVGFGSLLKVARPVVDQTGLNYDQRARNLAGAFSADSRSIMGKNEVALVMVDDVITSGSSLREGARALTSIGYPPCAAICACASARFLPIRLPQ